MADDERRQSPRIAVRVATEVRFTSWQVFSLIYTINISHSGMSIELPKAEAIGAKLTVRLLLPSGPPVELPAIVRHCTAHKGQFTVGVQFTDLDDAKKQALEHSIRSHGGELPTSIKRRT